MKVNEKKIKSHTRPQGMPFNITKLGHIVLNVSDVERSTKFYTEVMGFKVSDVYTDEIAPGGMVFFRYNADHHGIAVVGSMPGESPAIELNHLAFEVATLDEVFIAREHLKKHDVKIDFEGRRRAGAQIAVEFRDPDGHRLEIYWGLDQIGGDGYVRPPEEWVWAHSLEEAVDKPVKGQDTTLHNPSVYEKLAPEERERRRAHSIATQRVKLGGEH
ncbi:MAG TPA: VOC family protein [Stellaceae bacterium]|jgi:catechol 2,3-dioxygenase|nr:VOC family protein [Stellaceae bacterium]